MNSGDAKGLAHPSLSGLHIDLVAFRLASVAMPIEDTADK